MQCKPCTHSFSSLFFVKKEYCKKTKEKKLICTLLSHINYSDQEQAQDNVGVRETFFIEQLVTINLDGLPQSGEIKNKIRWQMEPRWWHVAHRREFWYFGELSSDPISSISVNCKTGQNPATDENWVL